MEEPARTCDGHVVGSDQRVGVVIPEDPGQRCEHLALQHFSFRKTALLSEGPGFELQSLGCGVVVLRKLQGRETTRSRHYFKMHLAELLLRHNLPVERLDPSVLLSE